MGGHANASLVPPPSTYEGEGEPRPFRWSVRRRPRELAHAGDARHRQHGVGVANGSFGFSGRDRRQQLGLDVRSISNPTSCPIMPLLWSMPTKARFRPIEGGGSRWPNTSANTPVLLGQIEHTWPALMPSRSPGAASLKVNGVQPPSSLIWVIVREIRLRQRRPATASALCSLRTGLSQRFGVLDVPLEREVWSPSRLEAGSSAHAKRG